MRKNVIYLISGPLGVGKSTISQELSIQLENCIWLPGDPLLLSLDRTNLSWEEKLQLSWENIRDFSRNNVKRNLNVVVDFVVEDELKWFYEEVSDLDVDLRYIVLIADKETLTQRLRKRGELQYLDRSLFLMEKLSKDPFNKNYLYNSNKDIQTIVKDLVNKKHFIVEFPSSNIIQ